VGAAKLWTKDSKWRARKEARRRRVTPQGFLYLSSHDIIRTIATRYKRSGMKKLTLPDYQALAEFRYQIRKFLHFSERAVHAAGLERGQYQLMLAIKGIPEGVRPRIRELANRMQIQHNSAVELVNRLEAGGYVRRERAQDDRREVLLALTPKGERVLAELALHHQDELRSSAPSLVAALRRLMPKKDGTKSRRKNPSAAKAGVSADLTRPLRQAQGKL
jgi:DNA-binding MarR family transcriptional regulator